MAMAMGVAGVHVPSCAAELPGVGRKCMSIVDSKQPWCAGDMSLRGPRPVGVAGA